MAADDKYKISNHGRIKLGWQRQYNCEKNRHWPAMVTQEQEIDPLEGEQIPPSFYVSLSRPQKSLCQVEKFLIGLKVPFNMWPSTATHLWKSDSIQIWNNLDNEYTEEATWPQFVGFITKVSSEIINMSRLHEFVMFPKMVPIASVENDNITSYPCYHVTTNSTTASLASKSTTKLPMLGKQHSQHNHEKYWCAVRYIKYMIQSCERISNIYLTNQGKWTLIMAKTRAVFPELYVEEFT